MTRLLAPLAALAALLCGTVAHTQAFDAYGGYTGLKGSNTSGFFRAEKIDGRYWLVTPDNNVLWSTGICVLQYYDTWGGQCPVTNQYPNPWGNKARYSGGASEWAAAMRARMNRWGFNTAACWGDGSIGSFTECIRDLSLCGSAPSYGCRMVTSDFPDVWDPKWETTCDSVANAYLSANKNNPYTIGSFPYNELHWSNPTGFKSLPDAFMALPAAAYGKAHWVNVFLKGKYAAVADLNTAYGTSFSTWDDVLNATSLPDDTNYPARLSDKIDFVEDIADKFYSVCTYYMRKYDPNHIVFTTRWAMWYQGYADPYTRPFNERIWKKAGQYCDVFANNGYADFAYAEATYQHSSRVFQNSKKPFIVTEHAYLANDSYFRDQPSWLATQMDRGNAYADHIKKLLDIGVADDPNDPGQPAKTCMGQHWFQCYDEPSWGRPDGEAANFGIFNCQDEAFLPLVEMAKTTNSQIYAYAINGTSFDIPSAPTAVSPIWAAWQQSENASSFERVFCADDPSLLHQTGSVVDDPAARKGKAACATVASGQANVCLVYGPYLPARGVWWGAQCTVTFRLKVSDNTSASAVAKVDAVTGGGAQVYASQDIKGADFTAPNTYQDFTLSFTVPGSAQDRWEFRVFFYKVADLCADTIKVRMQPTGGLMTGPLSDGSAATVWSSAEHDLADATEWAAVYLGSAPRQVSDVTVNAASSTAAGMPSDFRFEYSTDGAAWTTIPHQTYTNYRARPGAHEFTFEPVTCNYIRLYATRLGQDADGKYRLVLGGIDVVPKTQTATPAFTWNCTDPAQSYTLLASPVASFPEEQTIKTEGITGTSYTPATPLAQGTWYWTVKAVSPAGHEGKYLTTVRCDLGDFPGQFDHTAALKCERLPDWHNISIYDAGGDGCSFAFLDDAVKSEGLRSLRVAITVASLNKLTTTRNPGTTDIPFRYAGRPLDYSGISNFTFDIYPKRFCDTTAAIVPSTKYVRFRMTDFSGSIVADQAVDSAGSLPIGQWSTITVPLTGPRSQVTSLEFYVRSGADKLVWDERVNFNIDNLTTAPVADITPPTTPSIDPSLYTLDGTIRATLASADPETGIAEYLYAVGTAPGLDDLVSWRSNGASGDVNASGLPISDGQACYVSAKAVNGFSLTSDVGMSGPIRKVSPAANAAEARIRTQGSWLAIQGQVVTARSGDRFYVEQPDRSCGIGVLGASAVAVGNIVTVFGQTQVVGHELMLGGGAADVANGSPLAPVAMQNLAACGAGIGAQETPVDDAATNRLARGLANVGCLVTVFGKAKYVDNWGASFYIDDGSRLADGSGHSGVDVASAGLALPVTNTSCRVSGVASVTDVGGRCARLLRPRSASDLVYDDPCPALADPSFETGTLASWTSYGSIDGVQAGTWFGGITAHSGNCFFGNATDWGTKAGGVYQRIAVKKGCRCTARVFSRVYHTDNPSTSAISRVGLDPNGLTNPSGSGIKWSSWDQQATSGYSVWRELATAVGTCANGYVTVFLDYRQQTTAGWHINCFDDAMLNVSIP